MADVFAALVGQHRAEATLRRAAAAAALLVSSDTDPPGAHGAGEVPAAQGGVDRAAMTHAWLFTGAPGSGRSVAARAFAAALQCESGAGCGSCAGCHTTLAGTHTDVRLVVPEGLTIAVGDMRELVLRAAGVADRRALAGRGHRGRRPAQRAGRQRPAQGGGGAVPPDGLPALYAVRPPGRHTRDDPVPLPGGAVAPALRRGGRRGAASAATVPPRRSRPGRPPLRRGTSAGPGGWPATRLAGPPRGGAGRPAPAHRHRRLLRRGQRADRGGRAEADATVAELDARERAELETALGAGGTGKGAAGAARGSAGALGSWTRQHKARATRARRDSLDRALVDLAGFYRDVLIRTLRAPVPPVHVDAADTVARAAGRWTPESTLRRLEAVLACRDAIELNVKPRIAVEAMMLALWRG